MNDPIRRTAMIAIVLILALIGSSTWIQVVRAPALNADQRNVRTLYREYNTLRGPIVVDGVSIASSEPSGDVFGFQRVYSQGPLYAAVTGHYSVTMGRTGIELAANDTLAGTSDSLWWDRLQNLISGKVPAGYTVELTLNPAAQEAAAAALGDQAGAVVAIDTTTGAVLALYSSPTYDPNLMAVHSTSAAQENWESLLAEPGDPLINRAIGGDTYAPGSVFKLITAAQALESGEYTADSMLDGTNGYLLPGTSTTLRNFGGSTCSSSGEISLANALRISCNVAFAQLGNELGATALAERAGTFGFEQSLSIPLTVTPSRFPTDIDDAQTALAAIGQGSVRVTPLQIAMIAATIANDGVRMQPYLIAQVRRPDLTVVSTTEPVTAERAISSTTAATLTDMMVSVVANGTGTSAQIPGVTVAGKTGTAEDPAGSPHAWFTGFAPADNPRVAVAVVVEHGGNAGNEATGGRVAAPIARAVMEAVLASE